MSDFCLCGHVPECCNKRKMINVHFSKGNKEKEVDRDCLACPVDSASGEDQQRSIHYVDIVQLSQTVNVPHISATALFKFHTQQATPHYSLDFPATLAGVMLGSRILFFAIS